MEPNSVEYNRSERIKWLDAIKSLNQQIEQEKKELLNLESSFVKFQ